MEDFKYVQTVEEKRTALETERLRANDLTRATIEAEARKAKADAVLYAKQKNAQGILAKFQAEAKGINCIVNALGNDNEAVIQYMMIEKKLYLDLAKQSTQAIHGLKPNITVWSTGNPEESGKMFGTKTCAKT